MASSLQGSPKVYTDKSRYIYILYDNIREGKLNFCRSSLMLEKAVAALGVVRELSWTFVCPAYCGGSVVLPFGAGVAIGFLFGVICAIASILLLWNHLQTLFPAAPGPGAAAPHPSGAPHRSSRLARYLNEH